MRERKTRRLSIKEYPECARPREKLLALGSGGLSEQELLAILLRTGTKEQSALDLAGGLLARGGLVYLSQASMEELKNLRGIGLAKAAQLKAALELGIRLSRQMMGPRPKVSTPLEAARLVMSEMSGLDREYFKVINLNTKNQVLAVDTVSVGGLSSSLVHPREVFKPALKRSAASLILVHNHPSGDTQPSREDLEITCRLCEAGRLLGIAVVDHLVIGNNNFLSLKEKGYI